MIVAAIVAILASIAYPSYQNHIRETRRTDAMETLTRLAAAQEKYFFSNNAYADSLSKLGYSSSTSPEGYYTIGFVNPANHNANKIECKKGSAVYDCFKLEATPITGGAQVSDTECAALAIDHTGKKYSTDSNGSASDCW